MALFEGLLAKGMRHPVAMLVSEAIGGGGLPEPFGASGAVLISAGPGVTPTWGTLVAASFAMGPGIITPAMLDNGAALSVLGVTGNASAARADIAAASDGQVLRRSGTAVAFGAVNLASANAVTGLLPAANVTTGTSGANIPLLNGANTWSSLQTYSAGINLGNETLSVYDEGTFTPTIAFGGGSTGVTYTTQSGTYTRIGNRVMWGIRIVLTSRGSSTGNATIQTLPFTPAATTAAAWWANNYTIGAGLIPIFDTSSTTVRLRSFNPTTGNENNVAETAVDNDFNVTLSGSFAI